MDAYKNFDVRVRAFRSGKFDNLTPYALADMQRRATRLQLVSTPAELRPLETGNWADPAPKRLHPSIPRGPVRIADRTRKERLAMWLIKAAAVWCLVWAWWLL